MNISNGQGLVLDETKVITQENNPFHQVWDVQQPWCHHLRESTNYISAYARFLLVSVFQSFILLELSIN